jgi:hypothetical protein
LDKLKTIKRDIVKIVEKRIAVIKFRRDKSISKYDSRVSVKRRTHLSKSTNVIERCAANIRNMRFERQITIEYNTKIVTAFRRLEIVAMKRDRRRNELRSLLWSANEQKLSFRWIYR